MDDHYADCPCDDCTRQDQILKGSFLAIVLTFGALAAIGVALWLCT